MEVADSVNILNARSNLRKKIVEKFEKFQSQKLLKHFSNSSNFFQIFPVFSKYKFFWDFKQDAKKLWEMLRKFWEISEPKIASTFF